MARMFEQFLPALIKSVKRNGGILDRFQATKTFGNELVQEAIKRKLVEIRTIVLNKDAKYPLRIEYIAVEWDGSKPSWLNRYQEENNAANN